MGHAGTASIWRPADNQHPERLKSALATVARAGKPLHRSRDVVLRIRRHEGVRGPKSAPIDGEHELFGVVTTEANAIVAPIHQKAMTVILTTPERVHLWLSADAPEALELQRPLPDDLLRIVASGEREDRVREVA